MLLSKLVILAFPVFLLAVATGWLFGRQVVRRARTLEKAARERHSRVADEFIHEALNPLHAIRGIGELLERGDLGAAELRSHLLRLNESTEALLSLATNAQLCFGHACARNDANVDIQQLLEDLRGRALATAAARQLHFEIHLEPDAPALVVTDASLVRCLLGNIVNHCLAITEQGHVEITLHTGSDEEIRISISDTGPSLDAHALRQVFEPFGLAGHTCDGNPAGTGLNLHAALRAARLLGGKLTCASRLSAGSLYSIALPVTVRSRGATERENRVVSFADHYARHRAQVRRHRVLVAEDQISNAHVIQSALERAGHAVVVVHDGDSALERLAASDGFDLVVIDLRLPDISGLDVMKLSRLRPGLRHQPPPFIVLTSERSESVRTQCLAAGAWAFLQKPVSAQGLLDALAMVSDRVDRLARAPAVAHGQISLAAVHRTLLAVDPGRREFDVFRDLLGFLREIEGAAAINDWQTVVHRTRAVRGAAHLIGAAQVTLTSSQIVACKPDELPAVWPALHQRLTETVDDAWRTLSGMLAEVVRRG